MNILCIETSVSHGSIALQCAGRVSESVLATPRAHAEMIIPMIEASLKVGAIEPGQLDAIAFGRGPGSFIGIRLAAAVAQGLAAASGVGLAPVSSMAALAYRAATADPRNVERELHIVVCLDARMHEVYLAEYVWKNARLQTKRAEQLLQPAAVRLPAGEDWLAVGNGFAAHSQLLQRLPETTQSAWASTDLEPRARDLIAFAAAAVERDELITPEAWRSEYLRDESAWQRT